MTSDEIKWLSGIIDSEGSFYMAYEYRKNTKIRKCWFHLKTSDNIIVPYCSKLLNKSYNSSKTFHEFKMTGQQLKRLIVLTKNELFIKKRQAEICLEAIDIKNGKNTAYSHDEDKKWNNLYNKIKILNKRGKNSTNFGCNVNFNFSYQWFAGLIDGDGTITTAKFNSNNKKPFLKVTLTDHYCIDMLCSYFNKNVKKPDKVRGNRKQTKTIRFMSNDCYFILPKIIPYLKLKRKVAELALKIIKKRKINNNNKTDPQILEYLNLISKDNSSRYIN